MEIIIRKARSEDREKAIEIESKATPNLSYVDVVFDMSASYEF